MPRYTTVDNVLDIFPAISSNAVVSSAQIALAISFEESMVETLLAHRYTMPMTPVPPLLTTVVTDLAALRLLQTRLRDRQDEALVQTLQRANSLVRDIERGRLHLLDDNGKVIDQDSLNIVASVTDPRTFGSWSDDPFWRP